MQLVLMTLKWRKRQLEGWIVTGTAKFTHLWLLEQGAWNCARRNSYDHKSLTKLFVLDR